MTNKPYSFFFLAVLLLLTAPSCKKKDHNEFKLEGNISLIVKDDLGDPVEGYSVIIKNSKTHIEKKDLNEFSATLPVGEYQVTVTKEGMIGTTLSATIEYNEWTNLVAVLKWGEPVLNLISDSALRIPSPAINYTVKLKSSSNWIAETDADWIGISHDPDYEESEFILHINKNEGDTVRTAAVRISSGSLEREVHITQGAELRIKEIYGMPGNQMTDKLPVVLIRFNQNITLEEWRSETERCSGILQRIGNADSSIVEFQYSCGFTGGTYPFHISAKTSFGDEFKKTVDAGFYSKQLNVKSFLKSYYVNDADNSLWLLTTSPDKLLKIDMTSLEVLSEFSLPEKPTFFTINPYNNKIYLGYNYNPNLYIYNLDFTSYEVIPIHLDSSRLMIDHYGELQPEIYPTKLCFTESGVGLLSLSFDDYTGNSRFWIIDASKNHKTFYTNDEVMEWSAHEIKTIYDKTKLLFVTPYVDRHFYVFDPATLSFEAMESGKHSTSMEFITPSRASPLVYLNQYYYQGVINLDTKELAPFATLEAPDFPVFDFLYDSPSAPKGIRCGENTVEFLDFNKGETPVTSRAVSTFSILINTIDGKFTIMGRGDGNGNITVVQIPTNWLTE